jgi:diguanylate cyclase (GGDEF)-like protein/putative nucleotidyltransferase with HDIG domain
MSIVARLYFALIVAAGAAVAAHTVVHWSLVRPLEFLLYLGAAVAASNLKVTLPGVTGTMSVSFIFMLIGISELSFSQAALIGAAGIAAQIVMRTREHADWRQVLFNVGSILVSLFGSSAVFHSQWLRAAGFAIPLSAAGMTFFLLNTSTVAIIIALTEGKRPWAVWYRSFFWTAPHYMFGVTLVGLVHLVNEKFGWEFVFLVAPALYLVYHSYRLYLSRLEEEKNHVKEVADLHLRTIKALALAIDAKDNTTHDHLRRVQVYATGIATDLGLNEEDVQALQAAALLHDIGKLAVPEHIISKPGRLTPEEFEKMKIHPVVGAEILECVRFPYPVVPVVRAHHERWDGSGYPQGLKGEEIPMGARILAAVDCLDALATDRQYRRALPLDDAMQVVESESGRSFDPRVVEALKRKYVELEKQAQSAPADDTAARLTAGIAASTQGTPANGYERTQAPDQTAENFLASIAAARQEFHTLHELTSELGNSLSVEETLSLLALRLKPVIPHDAIAIYVRKGDRLVPEYVHGENSRLFASLEIPMGEGLSGWVAQKNRPIINGNPSVEPGYLNDPERFSTLRSAISVPLQGVDGVVGALTLYHAQADAFTRDHLRILQAIQSKAGLTIENALRFQQAATSAVTDELTGLPNARSLFLHLDLELARCKRTGEPLAVLVLDLDGFKQVNDRFGHLEGNKVLQLTAAGLRESCREYDYVARMGGDEFVVILPGAQPPGMLTKVHQFVEIARRAGAQVCGEEFLSLSAGDAFFPEDGADAEQLLAHADHRMYQMKHAHRGGFPAAGLAELPVETEILQ